MKKEKLRFFSLIFITFFSFSSLANDSKVKLSFCGRVLERIQKFHYEVKETNGLSLLLVQPPKDAKPAKWWNINDSVVQPATQKITKRVFGRAFQFSGLVLLASSLVVGNIEVRNYNRWANTVTKHHTIATINGKNRDSYERLINEDFRYNGIKHEKDQSQISDEQARENAFALRQIQKKYLEQIVTSYKNQHAENPLKADEDLLSEKTFAASILADIEKLKVQGVPEHEEGYIYSANTKKTLDTATLDNLIKIQNDLEIKMELVPIFINGGEALAQIQSDISLAVYLNKIVQNPLTQKLLPYYETNQITKGELITSLQEDFFWEARIQDWQALGLERQKRIRGRWTSETVTIEDYRSEIVTSLLKQKNL